MTEWPKIRLMHFPNSEKRGEKKLFFWMPRRQAPCVQQRLKIFLGFLYDILVFIFLRTSNFLSTNFGNDLSPFFVFLWWSSIQSIRGEVHSFENFQILWNVVLYYRLEQINDDMKQNNGSFVTQIFSQICLLEIDLIQVIEMELFLRTHLRFHYWLIQAHSSIITGRFLHPQ